MLPGVFGFLVWELKENWRLYAANRPRDLHPVMVGSHGESDAAPDEAGVPFRPIAQALCPAPPCQRKAHWTGNWKGVHKSHDALHHVEQDVRRFVERELANLLVHSRGWHGAQLPPARSCWLPTASWSSSTSAQLSKNSLWLTFEEQSGWLLAGVASRAG